MQQSIPVVLGTQGKWQIALALLGQPKAVRRDAKGRLWMQVAYFFLANRPVMHVSLDGKNWKGVALPFDNDSGRSFYQRNIES